MDLNKRTKMRKLKEDLISVGKFGILLLSSLVAIVLIYLVKDWTMINDNSNLNALAASVTIVGLNIGLFILGEFLK